MRRLAVAGMGLTAAMQSVFFANGFERGPAYLVLQVLAVAASATAAWGIARLPLTSGATALTVGLAWNALSRVIHMLFELSRLPPWLNWGIFAGYAMAAAFAGAWLARADDHRLAWTRFAFWWLAIAHFVASGVALSGGRLTSIAALAMGSVGYSLVAANLHVAR